MEIILATKEYENEVVLLFQKNLKKENLAIYSREFFCPFGVKSAIYRGQVLILLDENDVVGAVRFYSRKSSDIVSLYQFALDKNYRGKNKMSLIIKEILHSTGYKKIESLCPKDIEFNNYYKKTGWVLDRMDEKFNYWIMKK